LEPLYNNPSTPNRPWIAHLLAQCHQHAGRTAEADAIRPTGPLPSAHWPNDWTDELWNHRRDAEWLIQRAHERILARNPSAALAILAPLAPYYATDPAYLKMMGMAHFTQGDIDLAISYMEDVTQKSPDDAAAAMNLGFAYAKAGDLRAAQEATRRAVAIDPTNDAAAEQLVHIENALRNRGETP
jgi:Flp pilus assembly protein TadD